MHAVKTVYAFILLIQLKFTICELAYAIWYSHKYKHGLYSDGATLNSQWKRNAVNQ
jgi:hypothetical protein